jgi:hypothetical protein
MRILDGQPDRHGGASRRAAKGRAGHPSCPLRGRRSLSDRLDENLGVAPGISLANNPAWVYLSIDK